MGHSRYGFGYGKIRKLRLFSNPRSNTRTADLRSTPSPRLRSIVYRKYSDCAKIFDRPTRVNRSNPVILRNNPELHASALCHPRTERPVKAKPDGQIGRASCRERV